jgi:hypothetical protein
MLSSGLIERTVHPSASTTRAPKHTRSPTATSALDGRSVTRAGAPGVHAGSGGSGVVVVRGGAVVVVVVVVVGGEEPPVRSKL